MARQQAASALYSDGPDSDTDQFLDCLASELKTEQFSSFRSVGADMMKFLVAALLATAVLLAVFETTTQNVITPQQPSAAVANGIGSVMVDIPGQGAVIGNADTTLWTNQLYLQFLGIPYAESPSGQRRFMPPIPRLPWRQIVDGTSHGQRCPDISFASESTANQTHTTALEDCLNLNVYTKDITANLPVMFYVYGGAFVRGSANLYPPRYLLEKDIVLVVPNFRIGALGWLSTLTDAMPGNAPIMDLQLALKWVQQYIQAFGGDPTQVTVFGQSAGAAMTGALLVSPKTPDVHISRAIVQSGSIMADWAVNKRPRAQVERMCWAVDCAACGTENELQQCLKAAPLSKLLRATEQLQEFFGPVEGDLHGVMPQHPSELVNSYQRNIPIMTGFTKHDGSFKLAEFYDEMKLTYGNLSQLTVRQFANGLMSDLNDTSGIRNQLLTRLLFSNELLNSNDHKKALSAYFDVTNILYMKSPVITFASMMLNKNLAPVYLYTFDYEGANTRFGFGMDSSRYPFNGGVHHSNDNIYLFSTHTMNDEDTQMAEKMVELWTSFAIDGAPSVQAGPSISPMKMEVGPYFHIDREITIGDDVLQEITATIDDPESKKLDREDIEF